MGKAAPQDLRWRAVYGVWWDGLDAAEVATRLSMGPLQVQARWVRAMVNLFEDTWDVEDHQGQRAAPPANLIMTDEACYQLFDQMLDAPDLTL